MKGEVGTNRVEEEVLGRVLEEMEEMLTFERVVLRKTTVPDVHKHRRRGRLIALEDCSFRHRCERGRASPLE